MITEDYLSKKKGKKIYIKKREFNREPSER